MLIKKDSILKEVKKFKYFFKELIEFRIKLHSIKNKYFKVKHNLIVN